MNAYFQIARNTFRETLRQPVFFLVLASMLVLVVMIPYLALFVFGEAVKLVADSALASLLLFGFVYALLFVMFVFLLTRKIQHGPDSEEESEEMPESWKALIRTAPRT